MIGDTRTPPTLLASSNFTGFAVIGKHCGVHTRSSYVCPILKMPIHMSQTVVVLNGLSIKTTCVSNNVQCEHPDDNFTSQLPLCSQSDHRFASNECHCTCNGYPLASIAGNLTYQCRRGNVTREWHATPGYKLPCLESISDELTLTLQAFGWKMEGEKRLLERSECNTHFTP